MCVYQHMIWIFLLPAIVYAYEWKFEYFRDMFTFKLSVVL